MLSIIICSVDKQRLSNIQRNVAETIGDGVKYEIIAIDNSERKGSITAIYNEGARRAKYPCLLFVHEDVEFQTQDWFERILPCVSQPDCGVIGFAGSRAKVRTPSGWVQDKSWNVEYYSQMNKNGVISHHRRNLPHDVDFRQVVVLDGFALFMRREVWEEFPFDEKLLTGFHCYDIDISLSVGQKYKNYVCGNIKVLHYSSGNFGEAWLRDTLKLHYEKWEPYLPVWVEEPSDPISAAELRRVDEHVAFRLIKYIKTIDDIARIPYVYRFLKYRLTLNHLGHIIRAII